MHLDARARSNVESEWERREAYEVSHEPWSRGGTKKDKSMDGTTKWTGWTSDPNQARQGKHLDERMLHAAASSASPRIVSMAGFVGWRTCTSGGGIHNPLAEP